MASRIPLEASVPVVCPALSIIIEWENADRIGVSRAKRMLAALHAQLDEVGAAGSGSEVIFLYSQDSIDSETIRSLVEAAGGESGWPVDIQYVAAPNGHYYEQKNFGARQARNDIFLFLDSDVVPQEKWLERLSDSLRDPSVELVCGTTFIEHQNLYSAAVALIWFFPTLSDRRDLSKEKRFFANNVAFRRSLFEKNNFPDTGQFRGQCAILADQLMKNGHVIWRNHAAIVAHPPPDGVKHFLVRALMHGHDNNIAMKAERRASLRAGTAQFFQDLRRSALVIRKKRRLVGLGIPGAVSAGGIAVTYYSLKYLSYIAALIQPRLLNRALSRLDA